MECNRDFSPTVPPQGSVELIPSWRSGLSSIRRTESYCLDLRGGLRMNRRPSFTRQRGNTRLRLMPKQVLWISLLSPSLPSPAKLSVNSAPKTNPSKLYWAASRHRGPADTCIWSVSHVSDRGRANATAPDGCTHYGRGFGSTRRSIPTL